MTLCGHMTISQRDEGVHLPSPLCHRNMVQCIAGMITTYNKMLWRKSWHHFFQQKNPLFSPTFPISHPKCNSEESSVHWTLQQYFNIIFVRGVCRVWKMYLNVCWWFPNSVLTQASVAFFFWYRSLSFVFYSFSLSAIQLSLQEAESSKVHCSDQKV